MALTVLKAKTCRICPTKFIPVRPLQIVCGPACAVIHARVAVDRMNEKARKEKAAAHREAKVKAKTRQQWMKEAQAAVNLFIRLRDRLEPCISCGRQHQGQWHAGHYRSTKAAPELRFEELNIWKQCQPCNTHLSGNIVEYRKSLIAKIGVERVEWLEGKHEAKHYTIDDLREIKARYTKLAKELA